MHPATAPEADLPAALTRAPAGGWLLAGHWTAQGLGDLPRRLQAQSCDAGPLVLDGSALKAIDSAGAWVLQHWLGQHGAAATLQKWPPRGHQLMDQLGE